MIGCAGALVGLVLASCGLGLAVLLSAFGAPLPAPAPPDPARPDITITVQETYFVQMLAQSLPAGWADDLEIDVQPGNRLALSGRLKVTAFGQTLEGDLSAIIILDAADGQLVVRIGEINVSGFALSGAGETFINQLSAQVSTAINEQVKAGLGENAYIMSVATDDQQLILRARWQ